MKRTSLMTAALLGPMILTGMALLSAGKAISRNDVRALKGYDNHHVEMLARNCGTRGRLMQDPLTGEHLCLWTNVDGTSVAVATSPFIYLDQVAGK